MHFNKAKVHISRVKNENYSEVLTHVCFTNTKTDRTTTPSFFPTVSRQKVWYAYVLTVTHSVYVINSCDAEEVVPCNLHSAKYQ